MKTSDFDYDLPSSSIAQTPIEPRDHARLMVLDRQNGTINHDRFDSITQYLRSGDVLVLNDTRVIPARLFGEKVDTGAKIELLVLRRVGEGLWQALVKPGKRIHTGSQIKLRVRSGIESLAKVTDESVGGIRILEFSDERVLFDSGEMPLPPYIHHRLDDPERYQTVFSREQGSAAAPTAGLHFTSQLLENIQQNGVDCVFTTLHIGLDTFRPVTVENPAHHPIHREFGVLTEPAARRIMAAKRTGGRICCVGTTSVRLLEHAARMSPAGMLGFFEGWVDLLILPGYEFRMVDAMITNFHLPRSTLLMLVSAFTGISFIKTAYEEAKKTGYRFYSFGDAMLIT